MSENIKDEIIILRVSKKDKLLFEKNFELSGLKSRSDYIRRLITTYKVPSKMDNIKLNELRRIVGQLGKNTGILKLYITSLDMVAKKRIDMVISDNEKLKKEIKQILDTIKKDLGIK